MSQDRDETHTLVIEGAEMTDGVFSGSLAFKRLEAKCLFRVWYGPGPTQPQSFVGCLVDFESSNGSEASDVSNAAPDPERRATIRKAAVGGRQELTFWRLQDSARPEA